MTTKAFFVGFKALTIHSIKSPSTPKKTYILAITKKTNKQDIQKEPVFTYLVSEIGESRDIYRFDIEQNDLENAVLLFNQFKGAKNHFKTDELRCKIQPVEKFDSNLHWSVDRWWTKEEQIKLEILEENKTIPFNELPNLLEDVANNILAFKEEIDTIDIGIKTANNSNSKTVKIEDIFDLSIKTNSSKFTKNFINKHKGKIPVYSASKFPETVDYGYVKDHLKNILYFENCLTWNIAGLLYPN